MGKQTTTTILEAVKPSERAFTTVSAWEAATGISVAGADETEVGRLILRASAAIENYCNRPFALEKIKDSIWIERDSQPYYVPGGVSPLQLSRWPMVLDDDGTPLDLSVIEGIGASAETLTVDTDFEVSPSSGQLTRINTSGYVKMWPPTKIVVTYWSGYLVPGQAGSGDEVTLPADIEDACIRLVTGRWYERKRDPFLKSIQIEGVERVDYWIPAGDTGNFPPEVADLLDNYRVPVIS